MSARDDVLAAVRAALVPAAPAGGSVESAGGAGAGGAVPTTGDTPASTTAAPAVVDRAQVLDLFAERVADYRAEVTRCAAVDLAVVISGALAGVRRVVVPVGLGVEVEGATVDAGLTSAELDAVDVVVTGAAVGIAETGTVVLDHGPGQGRRAITLLPDLHVCVVLESQVVPGVGDALALLDPQRPQTWVSGPSATSDIELSRVEGVHGPRTLHVILVTP